jgi:hypothetical protein
LVKSVTSLTNPQAKKHPFLTIHNDVFNRLHK